MLEIRVEELAEGATHATLAEWLVEVGEHVNSKDVLAEVVTDKANIEIETPVSGVVVELKVPAGSEVTVGDMICVLEEGTA